MNERNEAFPNYEWANYYLNGHVSQDNSLHISQFFFLSPHTLSAICIHEWNMNPSQNPLAAHDAFLDNGGRTDGLQACMFDARMSMHKSKSRYIQNLSI